MKKNINFLNYNNKNISLPPQKKKLSILRSVFVDSKSKEHYGFYIYSCIINLDFIVEINLNLKKNKFYFFDLVFEKILKNLIKFREININYQKIKIFTNQKNFLNK